jgi:hypothetical protein
MGNKMVAKSEAELIGTWQHYTPQAYLRAWSLDPARRPNTVYVFRLSDGQKLQTPTKKICTAKGYWDYTGTDGLMHTYDPSLGRSEERALVALRLFRRNPTTAELLNTKPLLAYLGALLLLSNDLYRLNIEQLADATNEAYGTPIVTATDESIRHNHIRVLWQHLPWVVENLMAKHWMLVKNRTGIPFWTSDNPVAITGAKNRSVPLVIEGLEVGFPSTAMLLKDPEAVVWFPLSPTHLVMLVASSKRDNYSSDFIASEDHVREANGRQLYSANRYVFSNSAEFTLAEHLWQNDPRLQGEPRRRFNIAKVDLQPMSDTAQT